MSQHNQLQQHFSQHKFFFGGKRKKWFRPLIWHATIWCIWLHRNKVVFQGVVPDVQTVIHQIQGLSGLVLL